MNYSKKIFLTVLYLSCTSLHNTYSNENVKLTKSEIAKLKDFLVKTRDDAKTKVQEIEVRLEQMHNQQMMDLKSNKEVKKTEGKIEGWNDEFKSLKDKKYEWQGIVDSNNALLEQLRTGKYSYSLVMAQLKSLGTNPQDALQATGVRAKLLAGEKVHPLLVEVDAIKPDKPVDELNDAFKQYKISTKTDDRMNYILTDLLNRLLNKHREIMDKDGLKDTVAIIEEWITIFQNDPKLPKVFKTRVVGDPAKRTRAYAAIDRIKKEHDL